MSCEVRTGLLLYRGQARSAFQAIDGIGNVGKRLLVGTGAVLLNQATRSAKVLFQVGIT
jgi:hypothetical protein